MKTILYLLLSVLSMAVAGCGTASLDAGYRNDDGGITADDTPASLFEMQFGAGGRAQQKEL